MRLPLGKQSVSNVIINSFGHMLQNTLRPDLLLNMAREEYAQGTGVPRRVRVSGRSRKMLEGAGRDLAFRTPRAMECVWGDRKDTLSTTTAFTTMRMVTTRRKDRYLPGREEEERRQGWPFSTTCPDANPTHSGCSPRSLG